MVLERAGVPQSLQLFLRGIFSNSTTSVQHAPPTRGQFAMLRGVRQGCPTSCYLFTMAFDPVCRWLMTNVLPPEPHRRSLQKKACAYSEDFALAIGSLRQSLPIVADAFTGVE